MKLFLAILMLLSVHFVSAQTIKSFKTPTEENTKERASILDLLRYKMQKEFKQEFTFSVHIFNVSKKYAWVKVDAKRKDGKEIVFKKDEADFMDCCAVQALFIKKEKGWVVGEYGAFSTDVWYDGIWKRHNAPIQLWGYDYHKD